MKRIGLVRLLASLLVLELPNSALGQATVLVPDQSGYAWEVRELTFAPRKASDQGVSVASINTWNAAHAGMKQVKNICYMDFVQNDEIYSPFSETQKDISADLSQYPHSFATTYSPDPATKFLVRVGAFQICEPSSEGKSTTFMALVVTDEVGKVLFFDPTEWNLVRLFKRDDGVVNVLGCFACGEVRELAWDRSANRFYFVDIGH